MSSWTKHWIYGITLGISFLALIFVGTSIYSVYTMKNQCNSSFSQEHFILNNFSITNQEISLGFKRISPHPCGVLEGSLVQIDSDTVWTLNGLPCRANPNVNRTILNPQGPSPKNVHYYKISTNSWHEGPSIPHHIHHHFHSFFYYDNMLLLVGGIHFGISANRTNPHSHHNGIWMLDLNEEEDKQVWRSIASSVTTRSAMSHCTYLAHQDIFHYCLSGSAEQYLKDKHVFFRIDLTKLRMTYELALNASEAFINTEIYSDTNNTRPFDDRTTWPEQTGLITLLPEPPTRGSHLSIFFDEQPNDTFIIYLFEREVFNEAESNQTHRMTYGVHRYSLANEEWTLDETNIPYHITLYGARLTIQIPYNYSFDGNLAGTVFFFGGENSIADMLKITSDIVHFDPKTNVWRHVSQMPQAVYGMTGTLLLGTNQIMMVGGASGWIGEKAYFGRPCYRDVYLYTLPSEEQMATYVENTKKGTLSVIVAHFGHLDVTYKVKEIIGQNQITEFDVKIFVDTYLRDYVGQYWTHWPQWQWYEETLTMLLLRNGYLVSKSCPYIYSLCILTN